MTTVLTGQHEVRVDAAAGQTGHLRLVPVPDDVHVAALACGQMKWIRM